ncbi:alpha/beta hydrolase [Arthrobacter rhombi]|uniref:Alpha/beta hydrolase fold-5 domain-containing protein n=1 Tax=Arthrobacter rhombi TaxID=71253 RepID=A0A1R4GA34_9MICC|nr:alpha/beta hydrolase [Arthrobacter rhombi]SJM64917.1 hypothetical protein FM101_08895 [Arthrobacter rhombi]
MRLLRLYSGACILALVGIPAWMLLDNPAVLRGHPLLPALCAVALLGGIIWATVLFIGRSRSARSHPKRRVLHLIGAVAIRTLVLMLLAGLLWLNPFRAVALEQGLPDGVVMRESPTSITLSAPNASSTGFVFYPGARVEALAYRDLLAPLAAEGITVVILKEPLGLSIIDSGQAGPLLSKHPLITRWAVGGHSLGGVSAGIFAEDEPQVSGLILWGSYPVSDLSRIDRLSGLSISGSDDGLSTPATVRDAVPLLPRPTTSVVIDGGIHAYFGNYGPQPGDGTPQTGRASAQEQILGATQEFLAGLGT